MRQLVGYGSTAKEAISDFYVSYEELKQRDGDAVPEVEFSFQFDVGSLFNYYSFLNIEGIAKLAGISPAVLRQYASGARNPKESTLQTIRMALVEAAKQLERVVLCT